MELIKVYNDEKTKYFTTKREAAEFMQICYQNINYYLGKGKTVNGWKIEWSKDNVMSNEINKWTDD